MGFPSCSRVIGPIKSPNMLERARRRSLKMSLTLCLEAVKTKKEEQTVGDMEGGDGAKKKKKKEEERDEEQDGASVHSPCKAPPSSASSLPKEQSQVELELRLLEALEIYPPVKLRGIHRHFVLYGLMEFLRRSFDRPFSADEVLQLLDRFYNIEMLKPDDEDADMLAHEEDFSLPQSYFVKEE